MGKLFTRTVLIICVILLSGCQNLKNGNYYKHIGNLKINYTIKGKENAEVMLVGHPNSGKIGYELTLQPLQNYFKIVYYEPRGTGKSETPSKIEDYNQDFLVQEIEDLRKKLGVHKIWFFGHSDQSSIALVYALKFPQHVKGMILAGTSFIGTKAETIKRRKNNEVLRAEESEWFKQLIIDWDYMIANNTEVDKNGKDISNTPLKWWCYNEDSAQKVISIANEISKKGRRKQIQGKYYQETIIEREKYLSYQKKFNDITVPILIINGVHDTNNAPKFAEKLHNILPNSTLKLINKSGHFPWIENREVTFKEIKKWLNRVN